ASERATHSERGGILQRRRKQSGYDHRHGGPLSTPEPNLGGARKSHAEIWHAAAVGTRFQLFYLRLQRDIHFQFRSGLRGGQSLSIYADRVAWRYPQQCGVIVRRGALFAG